MTNTYDRRARLTYELYTPTIALVVPVNFERWDSFSVANTSRIEAKLTYVRLNTQTPCPPRGAVPVNQGRSRRLFHSLRPDRLRSWMRLAQLCWRTGYPNEALASIYCKYWNRAL